MFRKFINVSLCLVVIAVLFSSVVSAQIDLESREEQILKAEANKFKTTKTFPGAHKSLDYRYKDILLEKLLKKINERLLML